MKKRARSTVVVYRDVRTGQFIAMRIGRKRKTTATVERIPLPGAIHPKSAASISSIERRYGKLLDRLATR